GLSWATSSACWEAIWTGSCARTCCAPRRGDASRGGGAGARAQGAGRGRRLRRRHDRRHRRRGRARAGADHAKGRRRALRAGAGAHAPERAATLEVEVRDAEEIEQALAAGASRLLLDNMDEQRLRAAVAQVAGRAQLEASGGVTLQTLRACAQTGIEWVSMGA